MRITAIIMAILLPVLSQAQMDKVDSLKQALAEESDARAKLEILRPLLQHTQSRDLTQGWYYASMYDSIAATLKDTVKMGMGKKLLGTSAYFEGNMELATSYFLKAGELFEAARDTPQIASIYNNLGAIYIQRDLDEKALEVFLAAYPLYYAKGIDRSKAIINSNVGSVYLQLDSLDKAKPYLEESVRLYSQSTWKDQASQPLNGLARIEYESENYNEALLLLDSSLHLVSETRGIDTKYESLSLKINVLEKLGRKGEILPIIKMIERHVQDNQLKIREADLLGIWVNYFASQGHWEKAYTMNLEKQAMLDSARTLEQEKNIDELIQKYETEKKEQEIVLLDTEKKLIETRLKTTSRRYLVVGIGSLLLLGLLIYALSLNSKLKQAVQDKNILLKEIHHRVKNNLQVISSLLTLQSRYISDEQAVSALQKGHDRVESMALIHKNLYQHDNLKGVNTKDYLQRLSAHLVESYRLTDHQVQLYLDVDEIMLDVETMIPLGLIINELISNSLKHAQWGSEVGAIDISLKDKGDLLILRVSDNGKTNTSENTHQSFGQSLVRALARRLDASVNVSWENGYQVIMNIKEYKKVG